MNVEIVTVTARFLFWEYLFRIFGIVSLQCHKEVTNDLEESWPSRHTTVPAGISYPLHHKYSLLFFTTSVQKSKKNVSRAVSKKGYFKLVIYSDVFGTKISIKQ